MPSQWFRARKQELLRKTRRIPVAEVLDITKTFEMTETWRKQGGWNSALFRALQDFGQDCRLEVTQFTSTDHP
jgi:hypothetical protein